VCSTGHNIGIVAPPDEEGHSYQVMTKRADDPYVGPEAWLKLAPHREASWWTEWVQFLTAHSGPVVAPPRGPEALGDAPGTYVLQR
jgi:polyhydroxyalkanoate synthase subunit PhaC